MSSNDVKNIILVDDHPVVLNGLKSLLSTVENFNIIADASNGKDALLLLENNEPDIVITDISMPEMDGIELTENIKKNYPEIKVLILTVHNESEILKRALLSGAEACLQKNSSIKELVRAINKISDNGYYYCDDVISIARQIQQENMTVAEPQAESDIVSLSKREKEVFVLLLKGSSNKETADELFISHHTVATHRKSIMKKTKSKNIFGLYSYAKGHNLFPSLIKDNYPK